jgi:1,4-dihydroxy-2-naphthoyl-CoA hydrolase
MEVTPAHLAPNGYCHAASIIALADSACGAGAFMTLPKGVVNFTTATLTSSHVGTATSGRVTCEAVGTHLGRTTQVWDATVMNPAGKRIAMLRVTQILLRPK